MQRFVLVTSSPSEMLMCLQCRGESNLCLPLYGEPLGMNRERIEGIQGLEFFSHLISAIFWVNKVFQLV